MTPTVLRILAFEVWQELLFNILPFWARYKDPRGGYFGHIHNDGTYDADAPKGLVMHTRLLWTFSQAIYFIPTSQQQRVWLLKQADQAHRYLITTLHDDQNGGFHWAVEANGRPLPGPKIVYGQAFAIYALSAYYRATGNRKALELALKTFDLMEAVARDRLHGGFWEGVSTDWSRSSLAALGQDDPNCAKSMNTNLHVMEAWTALHFALCEAEEQGDIALHTNRMKVEESLEYLIELHLSKIKVKSGHLGLYFDEDWKGKHTIESYGHDAEASWLVAEAGSRLWGQHVPAHIKTFVLDLAGHTADLLDRHGGSLPNELHNGTLDLDRIWWVQAETMVAMVNLWQLTGDERHLTRTSKVWEYISTHLIDREHGEWYWGVRPDGSVMPGREKGGLWKANYHNGRACMEIVARAQEGIIAM